MEKIKKVNELVDSLENRERLSIVNRKLQDINIKQELQETIELLQAMCYGDVSVPEVEDKIEILEEIIRKL